MVFVNRGGEHVARVESVLLGAAGEDGRFGIHVNKLRVDEGDSVLIGHGLSIEIEHRHEWRYLILVGSPSCC